ncbi:MAG TPA: hypothetical protein VIW29_16575 [Polyangiaceae bacterium]
MVPLLSKVASVKKFRFLGAILAGNIVVHRDSALIHGPSVQLAGSEPLY